MRQIIIDRLKGIPHLKFNIPDKNDVYLIVGENGIGKTTLLICLQRICHSLAFAEGFPASRISEVDQYANASVKYKTDNGEVTFKKGNQRWVPSPRKNSTIVLPMFGFSDAIFVAANAKRIDATAEEIREGNYVPADGNIIEKMNNIFDTDRFTGMKRLRNVRGRRWSTYFYVLPEEDANYYSEKRFSAGEIAVLRLIEKIHETESNALVLVDEAEMALHPRIQKRLLDYLREESINKNLMVFISTHSSTLIKTTPIQNIIMLEKETDESIEVVCPCYPAKAIGSIDFIENTICDFIFFVEDNKAHLLLKEIIKKYIKLHQEHATALYRIIPVGGYLQTAILAKNTRRQLHSQSKVYAILDEDAFTIPDTQNPEFVRLRSKNRDLIYSLRCTPELWIIDKFEKRNLAVQKAIRAKFGCEYQNLINAPKYQACNSPSPRRLAKYKTNVLIDLLKEYSGETEDNIFARLASILIEQHLPNEEIDNFMRQFFN